MYTAIIIARYLIVDILWQARHYNQLDNVLEKARRDVFDTAATVATWRDTPTMDSLIDKVQGGTFNPSAMLSA